MLRPRPTLLALACAALLGLAAVASAGTVDPGAAAKKVCIVHRYTSAGKKVVYRVSVYRYKIVRSNGRRVRLIVKRNLAVRGSCSPSRACVKIRVGATGNVKIVYARRRVNVRVKRGNRLVSRRVTKEVAVRGKCIKPGSGSKDPNADLGVPVKITIIPPSKALLDFGAFQREAPIGGTMTGYSPQAKIDITKDIPIVFTSASISLGSTPVYIDQDCGGRPTASIRTGKQASVLLDDSHDSTSLLSTSGAVTASTFFQVRLPLELRDGETGCDKPYIDTQYSEWPLHLGLSGKLDPKTGLSRLHLTSPSVQATDLTICLNPGLQTEPCSGYQIPLPIFIATDVYVKVDLKAK